MESRTTLVLPSAYHWRRQVKCAHLHHPEALPISSPCNFSSDSCRGTLPFSLVFSSFPPVSPSSLHTQNCPWNICSTRVVWQHRRSPWQFQPERTGNPIDRRNFLANRTVWDTMRKWTARLHDFGSPSVFLCSRFYMEAKGDIFRAFFHRTSKKRARFNCPERTFWKTDRYFTGIDVSSVEMFDRCCCAVGILETDEGKLPEHSISCVFETAFRYCAIHRKQRSQSIFRHLQFGQNEFSRTNFFYGRHNEQIWNTPHLGGVGVGVWPWSRTDTCIKFSQVNFCSRDQVELLHFAPQHTRVILEVFSVMFSTLLRSGFVLVRQSIVLCGQERFVRWTWRKSFSITLVRTTEHASHSIVSHLPPSSSQVLLMRFHNCPQWLEFGFVNVSLNFIVAILCFNIISCLLFISTIFYQMKGTSKVAFPLKLVSNSNLASEFGIGLWCFVFKILAFLWIVQKNKQTKLCHNLAKPAKNNHTKNNIYIHEK